MSSSSTQSPSEAFSILLHPRPQHHANHHQLPAVPANPLPTLLHTPSGLALLELQGTINLPATVSLASPDDTTTGMGTQPPSSAPGGSSAPILIGRLHFPDYPGPDVGSGHKDDQEAWMKRVWLYVGGHQRLQGDVRRLPRAVAVLRRRRRKTTTTTTTTTTTITWGAGQLEGEEGGENGEGDGELEVVEIVKYKVVFSSRPEPVGSVVT